MPLINLPTRVGARIPVTAKGVWVKVHRSHLLVSNQCWLPLPSLTIFLASDDQRSAVRVTWHRQIHETDQYLSWCCLTRAHTAPQARHRQDCRAETLARRCSCGEGRPQLCVIPGHPNHHIDSDFSAVREGLSQGRWIFLLLVCLTWGVNIVLTW